jgi:N-acetylneuraminate epimerase
MRITHALWCAAVLLMSLQSPAAEVSLTWEQLPPLPDPLGVAAPFAGVSGDALIVAGGANFPAGMPWEGGKKAWTDRVWLLDSPTGKWQSVGRLPRPLGYGISATTPRGLVCVGGSDADRHYADAFRLEWHDGQLLTSSLPALPLPLSGASWATIGNVLYVACGSEEPGEKSATNRAFAIDLSANQVAWRELPPLPGKPRLLAVGAAHGGAFLVMGGAALEPNDAGKMARSYLREAWAFRPESGWKRVADLPRPCVAAPSPAPVVSGRILLIAGDDGSRVNFQTIAEHPGFPAGMLAYDPVADRWTEAGKTPAPRATVPCLEWRGRFVIPSGEVRPGVRSPETWSFHPR